MKGETFRLPSETEFKPAAETEKDIPEQLRRLHEIEGKFLGRGVFFDVYEIDLPDEEGKPEKFVFKDFRSGDVTMSSKEQIALFQHQYYEWASLKVDVGEKFFPKSYWIRSTGFSEEEAHGFFSKPGKTANNMEEFIKVQLDRQMANRYSSDDKKKGSLKKIMVQIGEKIAPDHEKKEFIGAIVQEKVDGVSLAEALKRLDKSSPIYEKIKQAVNELIAGIKRYHEESPVGAFTWHGLESDNVMAEVDENGELTGNIFIIDANFIERPNKLFRDKVLKKLEKDVFQKLEDALEL
ncbi:hypothetical protein HYT45_02635 [Candidatus Uhrbacteria bacterium]|nr:hypothetical protein [Candidatus Uhrbacteria bacterium]